MEDQNNQIKNELISFIINEKTDLLIKTLNSSFFIQKIFIEIIVQLINNSFIYNNISDLSILEKLKGILPDTIIKLGIPFCDLIIENSQILNYFYDLYFGENSRNKNILLNLIDIFNFESLQINPADDLLERLRAKDSYNYEFIKNKKRKNKTEIEYLYDEISFLYSNLRIRINIEENLENEILKIFESSIKEVINRLNKLKKQNQYPLSIFEYFQEKINNFENLFKKSNNINKSPSNFNINNINLENNISEILKKIREIPLKDRTSFYKDEELTQGEDEFTEFKNYYLPLTEEKGEELKRQFCAFLNNKGGRLYIGINDQKIVKGIILNYKKCDDLRNLLVNYTYDFYPKCRLDKIKVYFIPIKNIQNNKFINDLYIVKIIILQGDPFILYSMTNKGFKSAIRLQGQCANLTAEEITKEIIRRGKLGESQNFNFANYSNNKQFNDPEPEKNYEYESDSNDTEENIIVDKNKTIKINKKDIITVTVKNLDKNLDVKDIYDKFKDCGSIEQKFYSKEGKSRGYGFLKFCNENNVISTIKNFDNLQIGKYKISLMIKK